MAKPSKTMNKDEENFFSHCDKTNTIEHNSMLALKTGK